MVESTPELWERTTKSGLAYAELRRGIFAERWAPGAVLNQPAVARELGISTTPLREALRRLSAEGLVELSSHRDARVTPLTASEARWIMEVRTALDPVAVRLAAQNRSNADVAAIVEALRTLDQESARAGVVPTREHRHFHATVYRSSHNELMIATLDSLWDKSERYRNVGGRHVAATGERDARPALARKAAEHQAIVDAVLRQDGEEGARLMSEHIAHSLVARAAEVLSEAERATEVDRA